MRGNHEADLLRYLLFYEHGGVYLKTDVIIARTLCKTPFSGLNKIFFLRNFGKGFMGQFPGACGSLVLLLGSCLCFLSASGVVWAATCAAGLRELWRFWICCSEVLDRSK